MRWRHVYRCLVPRFSFSFPSTSSDLFSFQHPLPVCARLICSFDTGNPVPSTSTQDILKSPGFRVALNRRASAPSTTTFSPRNRVFAIQNYGTACRLSCAPRNTEIGTKQRASGRGVAEEELQEEETRDYEGKRRPVMPRRRIWGSSSCSA
jgi:hypothetical protein